MACRRLAAALLAVLAAAAAAAQNDQVSLTDGTVLQGIKVSSFDVRSLRYLKDGAQDSVLADQVAKVELGKFDDVYRRGLDDPDTMLAIARDQLAQKNVLMAQLGFVGAASRFFDRDDAGKAIAALDELHKVIPEGGMVPEVYRQKFEHHMRLGARGAGAAAQVAKKYQADAMAGGWPTGFAAEAEFFLVLADHGAAKDFQARLRSVVAKAAGVNPAVVDRANAELADSLWDGKDVDGSKQIYQELSNKDGVDAATRARALLGLGRVLLQQAPEGDKDACKNALLTFLKVRLETRDARPELQAEALYRAIAAADRWRGPEYTLVMSRCRRELLRDYPRSEWAQRAKAGK